MDNQVIDIIKKVIQQHGLSVLTDVKRCRSLLLDYSSGSCTHEIRLISIAFDEDIVKDLQYPPAGLPTTLLYSRLVDRLVTKRFLDKVVADWVVLTWAKALGITLSTIPLIESVSPSVSSSVSMTTQSITQEKTIQNTASNILNLAIVAEKCSNYQQAYEYASKALEFESDNYNAWKIKAKSTCWLSTLVTPRYTEGVICAQEAIRFAPECEKETVANALLEELSFAIFAMYNKTVEIYLIGAPNKEQQAVIHLNCLLLPLKELFKLEYITQDGYRKIMNFMTTFFKVHDIEPFHSFRINIVNAICDSARQTVNYQEIQDFKDSFPSKAKDGSCYIATAIYGSYNCPTVWTLRRYRDNILAEKWYGRIFINLYYFISPFILKYFGHTQWFNKIGRCYLDRLTIKLQRQGIENLPYQDK